MTVQTDRCTPMAQQEQLPIMYLWNISTQVFLYFTSFNILTDRTMEYITHYNDMKQALLLSNNAYSEEGVDPWGR